MHGLCISALVIAASIALLIPPVRRLVRLQVLFMTATRAELLERVKWRRVDYEQGHEPFHMPPGPEPTAKGAKGAPPPASAVHEPPVLPLTPEGTVDQTRVARLQPRHDDSQENVLRRLELWDLYCEEVPPLPSVMRAACAAAACAIVIGLWAVLKPPKR